MLFIAAAPGANAHLDKARELMRGVKYAAALVELKKAEEVQDNPTAALAEIHELAGLAHAALKHSTDATMEFTRLLVIAPQHRFASQQAPRVMTAYLEARTMVNEKGPITLRVGLSKWESDNQVTVTLELNDFLGLAHAIDVNLVEDGVQRSDSLDITQSLNVVAHGTHVEVRATVLGANRGMLAKLAPMTLDAPKAVTNAVPAGQRATTGESATQAPPEAVASPSAPAQRSNVPVIAGVTLLVAGVAALGTGAYFGVTSRQARTQYQQGVQGSVATLTYPTAMALQRTTQQDAVIANVLFAGGAALAVAGLGIGVAGLVVTPAPQGVAVAGSFP
jgi:hypothetical protein